MDGLGVVLVRSRIVAARQRDGRARVERARRCSGRVPPLVLLLSVELLNRALKCHHAETAREARAEIHETAE